MSLKHCIKQVISYKAGNKMEENLFPEFKTVAYNLITRYQISFFFWDARMVNKNRFSII